MKVDPTDEVSIGFKYSPDNEHYCT